MNDYYGGIGPGWGYGWGFGGGYYGGAFGWDYPYMQNETRIAVDVFDARSRRQSGTPPSVRPSRSCAARTRWEDQCGRRGDIL